MGMSLNPLLRNLVPSPRRLLFVAALLLIALLLYSVRNTMTRLSILAALAAIDVLFFLSYYRGRKLIIAAAIPQLLLAIFLILPGRPHDPTALRNAYVAALNRFHGTSYVWGGETHLGIDCSGLIRAAYVEANLIQSIKTFNPRLLRRALWLWWNDCAANNLPDNYHNLTTPLGPAIKLRDIPHDFLKPGDFASDRVHVLAYLGDGQWIQADPAILRVIRIQPDDSSQWWNANVIPARWKDLDYSIHR